MQSRSTLTFILALGLVRSFLEAQPAADRSIVPEGNAVWGRVPILLRISARALLLIAILAD